jgi:cytochrome c oxidase cbb3-type subunit III
VLVVRRTAGVLASLLVLISAAHASAQRTSAPRGATRGVVPATQNVAAGKLVFDAQCAWCHGAGGDGGTGPNLRGTLRHATDYASIVDIIMRGIPGTEMPSFQVPLTDHHIRQAAAYVQSLGRAKATPLAGNPQHGAAVYDANGCGSCHVIGGRGGITGPELTSIGALRGAAYLRESIVKPAAAHPTGYLVVRAVTNGGTEVRGIRLNEDVFWIQLRDAGGNVHVLQKSELSKVERQLDASLMPSYASRIDGSDLDDLVVYLSTLRGVK